MLYFTDQTACPFLYGENFNVRPEGIYSSVMSLLVIKLLLGRFSMWMTFCEEFGERFSIDRK